MKRNIGDSGVNGITYRVILLVVLCPLLDINQFLDHMTSLGLQSQVASFVYYSYKQGFGIGVNSYFVKALAFANTTSWLI